MNYTFDPNSVVRVSMMTVKAKDTETEQLVQEYLANGGQITYCSSGARAIKITNEVEGSAWGAPKAKKKSRKKIS